MSEKRQGALADALAGLETALEMPVVPGELELWARDVVRRADDLRPLLVARCREEHEKAYTEISSEDPALLRRVEQLRAEDKGILRDFDAFVARGRELLDEIKACGSDEASCEESRGGLERAGLELVIRIRKHVLAIATWLGEATTRDRGVKD